LSHNPEQGFGRTADSGAFTYFDLLACVIPKGGAHQVDLTGDPTSPTYRRQLVDVQALTGRGIWTNTPVLSNPAVTRNYRDGQIVLVGFRSANYRLPIVIGHWENTEGDTRLANPLIVPVDDAGESLRLDDQVYIHPETGAFLRFRNLGTTRTFGSPIGPAQPCELRVRLTSGAEIKLTESGGAPATQCAVALTIPTGNGNVTVTIDGDTGAVVVDSPQSIVVSAPDVELGADSGQDDNCLVVRKSDIENYIRNIFNEHTHPSNGAPPSQQMSEPPYAAKTYAE
jgi:hypothetical protein